MTDQEFETFLDTSVAALRQKQGALEPDFGFGTHARWHFDQAAGTLALFDVSDRKLLEADVVDLGSYAVNSGSWMWAWANESVSPSLRDRAAALKELADLTGVALFASIAPFKLDSESMAWDIAAMCVRHLGALGVYKAASPSGTMATFLAIRTIRKCVA